MSCERRRDFGVTHYRYILFVHRREFLHVGSPDELLGSQVAATGGGISL
nr:MAG TPA: hypothetical protein [Caudoviricetes sp.]